MLNRAVEEADLAGGEVVPAGDLDAVGEESVNESGADETGRAGDEDVVHAERRVTVKVRVKVKVGVGVKVGAG